MPLHGNRFIFSSHTYFASPWRSWQSLAFCLRSYARLQKGKQSSRTYAQVKRAPFLVLFLGGSSLDPPAWSLCSEEPDCMRWDLAPTLSLSGAKQTLGKALRLITMHLFKQTSSVWIKVIPLMCPQKPLECVPHESAEERCLACLRIAEWYKSCNYGVSVAFRLLIREIKPCCIFALS